MDLTIQGENVAFERDLRAFLAAKWRPDKSSTTAERAASIAAFRQEATERGYLYRGVPKRFGGSEQAPDIVKAEIIRRAFAEARAPGEVGGNGVTMVVPTLLECGSEAQKAEFIPRTLTGELTWAQGYSEPGSGSDLASLRTKAELIGDEWVIHGHKIWTSYATACNHMFALVRTELEAPKHDGISYLLLALDQPGVTVRPIRQITGQAEFCEVFLDGARARRDWLVGERGQGWRVSKSTLRHERNAVGGGARTQQLFDALVRFAKNARIGGAPAIRDPLVRDRLIQIEARLQAHFYSGYYQLTKSASGESAGVLSLTNKLSATEVGKDIAELAQEILDRHGLNMPTGGGAERHPEQWLNQIFGSLALSIAGGASNIQRSIIAEKGLGLPRDFEVPAHEV
ncbi:MAG: acyl-CoA dehydrogenase family protein [Hyphomonadaceae bacterium]|nr:acyl-CoA dehydrogenase family protein [Hyphomonadaceae bacterium]